VTAPIDVLLSRLAPYKLRKTGHDRWRACCPAHGGSNASTLSVAVADNGSVLLKCWHGCSADEVVCALGLDLQDLFPPRPAAGAGAKGSRLSLPASQALEILNREALLIYVVASDVHKKRQINNTDFDRLTVAVRRVGQIAVATR
jgi:hypothetical protein